MTKDEIAYCCIEDGISKELQPLIVQWLALVIATPNALVHQCLLVVLDLTWIETKYLVQRRKKLLLLAEREP